MTSLRLALRAVRTARTHLLHAIHLQPGTESSRAVLEAEVLRLSERERALVGDISRQEGRP